LQRHVQVIAAKGSFDKNQFLMNVRRLTGQGKVK